MSSPLDGRIRSIARDEAQQAIQSVGVLDTTARDAQGLQRQITDLHEHLHHAATTISRLEKRIDALEAAAGMANVQAPVGVTESPRPRGRRKATDT